MLVAKPDISGESGKRRISTAIRGSRYPEFFDSYFKKSDDHFYNRVTKGGYLILYNGSKGPFNYLSGKNDDNNSDAVVYTPEKGDRKLLLLTDNLTNFYSGHTMELSDESVRRVLKSRGLNRDNVGRFGNMGLVLLISGEVVILGGVIGQAIQSGRFPDSESLYHAALPYVTMSYVGLGLLGLAALTGVSYFPAKLGAHIHDHIRTRPIISNFQTDNIFFGSEAAQYVDYTNACDKREKERYNFWNELNGYLKDGECQLLDGCETPKDVTLELFESGKQRQSLKDTSALLREFEGVVTNHADVLEFTDKYWSDHREELEDYPFIVEKEKAA